MKLQFGPDYVDFVAEAQLAGRYHHINAWKPYFYPLCTPGGHNVALAMPHDHVHHRGLMYALRTRYVNFWEERSTLPGEEPGRQVHERFAQLQAEGEQAGFTEVLRWEPYGGGAPVFREERTISCRLLPGDGAYEWQWRTEIEMLRGVELIMSQWSARKPDGRRVNYHGLGLRFVRDFSYQDACRLEVDGVATPFADGMGMAPRTVVVQGKLDGAWPPPEVAVRIVQAQENAMYVCDQPFAFVGLGPSNQAPLVLQQGDVLREQYTVTVADVPAKHG
jgi:hypothetical protein